MYTVARDSFEALRTGYPLSPYVEFSSLKIADCYFETNEFLDAAREYEDFTKTHPVSESTPYALMMAGRSHQLSNRGVGRDTAPLVKALEFYDRFLGQYGASGYSATVAKFKRETEKILADYEQEVIAYYQRKGRDKAAEARKSAYGSRWAGLKEAEEENTADNIANSNASPAQILASIEAEERSRPLVADAAKQASAPSTAAGKYAPASAPQTGGPSLVSNIDCRTEPRKIVTIFLNRRLKDDELPSEKHIAASKAGELSLELPETPAQVKDCFALGDFKVSKEGELKLKTTGKARVMLMSNPERLLLIFDKE